MCTISWIHDKDGYQLLCNRDEKLTRKSALEPRLAVRNGTRFLAPVDGDFGGTWIATNEFGVSVCLLNGANLTGSEIHAATPGRSRGLLLLDLISLPSVAAMSDPGSTVVLGNGRGRISSFVTAAGSHSVRIECTGFDRAADVDASQGFLSGDESAGVSAGGIESGAGH